MLPHWTQVYVTISVYVIQLQFLGYECKDFSGPDVRGQKITKIDIPNQQRCGASKYSCGMGASCIAGVCQCPISTTGDPRLVCLPEGSFDTEIRGDPVVTGYDNSNAHVSFSCRTLLTEIKSKHNLGKSGGRCHAKIYTLLHRELDGYYLLAIDIELMVKDKDNPGTRGRVAKRIFGYDDEGVAAYKEQSHIQQKSMPRYLKNFGHLSYLNRMVRTSYNKEENMVTMSVPACGITTHFRAHVKYSHQFSGLAVSVSKDNDPRFPSSNYPLSGSPHADGEPLQFIQERHALHLTREQLTLYKALRQDAPQDFGINGLSCTIATKMFNRLCPDDASKALAVATCSGFYTNNTVLTCMLSGEFGASSSSTFALCTQAICLNHQSLCEDLKSEMALVGCGLHREFDALDCGNIAVTLQKFRGMVKTKEPENYGFFKEDMFQDGGYGYK